MTGKTPKWLNSVAYAKKGFFELNWSDMKTQMLNLLYTWQTFQEFETTDMLTEMVEFTLHMTNFLGMRYI